MCVWLWMFGPPGVWNPEKKGLVVPCFLHLAQKCQ